MTIEKRDTGAGGDDIGWTPVATQRIQRINAANMWGGMIQLTDTVDSTNHRVVIKEVELFLSDPSDPNKRPTSLGNQTDGTGDIEMEYDRRIVYADVLPLY